MIEIIKRNIFSATVTSLQAKVESLATTNALMKEDLSITRSSNDKIQAENRKLKGEMEKLRKLENSKKTSDPSAARKASTSEPGHQEAKEEKRASFVQVKTNILALLKNTVSDLLFLDTIDSKGLSR